MQSFELPDEPVIRQHRPQDLRKYSIVPIRAANDRRILPAAMRVLLVVCSYANRAGLCWPSHENVGKALGVSRQAAGRQIRKLIEMGYLHKIKNHSMGKTAQILRVMYNEDMADRTLLQTVNFEDLPPEHQRYQLKKQDKLLNKGKDTFNIVALTPTEDKVGELVGRAYIARWISFNRSAGFSRIATPEDYTVIEELAVAGVTVPVLDSVVGPVIAATQGTSREPPHRISAFRRAALDAMSKQHHTSPHPTGM